MHKHLAILCMEYHQTFSVKVRFKFYMDNLSLMSFKSFAFFFFFPGTWIVTHMFALHRNPHVWVDPEVI